MCLLSVRGRRADRTQAKHSQILYYSETSAVQVELGTQDASNSSVFREREMFIIEVLEMKRKSN